MEPTAPEAIFHNIPGLVNVNKKRWKITMLNGKTQLFLWLAIQVRKLSRSLPEGTTHVELWKSNPSTIKSSRSPIRSPTKGCDSQQLE